MLLLVVNGSPRRGGHVDAMLAAMGQEAARQGWQVAELRVSELRVAPCRGCMKCRLRGECVLPADDANRAASLLGRADALIVGAPCYWANIPGQLKVLFDRMVYAFMAEGKGVLPKPLHRGKHAIVVTACTTPWPFNRLFGQSRGTVRALRTILRAGGFRIVGTVQKGGTKARPGLTDGELRRCSRLVGRL